MTVSMKDCMASLDALGGLGLWAPWKVSRADAEAGIEAATTRMATASILLQLAEEARVDGDDLRAAAAHWTGDRWPAPRELIEAVRKRRPAEGPTGGCARGATGSCSDAGLIPVAVHYSTAEGFPAVWVGACYCDCERGIHAAGRQAEPLEKGGPERAPGITLRMLHDRFDARGTLREFIVSPEPWQRLQMGDPRRRPISEEKAALAERLHRVAADASALAERAFR